MVVGTPESVLVDAADAVAAVVVVVVYVVAAAVPVAHAVS